ncbi:MAG: hypothetical protein B6I20_10730, partial [Bacteroidetes bacterium 4572_117]
AYNLSFEFSEDVTGFVIDDITVGNGAASNFVAVDGNTYTADITPDGNGNITIDVAAAVAIDAANNDNIAASRALTIYDVIQPTVEITQALGQTDPTNIGMINFIATFSEEVTGFTGDDIDLSGTANPTTVDVTGSSPEFNVAVSGMANDGTVIVTIPGAVCTDIAGNVNSASTNADNEVVYDTGRPSVVISSSESGITELSNIPFTIEFSEFVQDFVQTDVTISNGDISDFTQDVQNKQWSGIINPIAPGTINIFVEANIANDFAGNGNLISNIFTVEYRQSNHAPVVNNQEFDVNETDEAGKLIGTVVASDEDNDILSFSIISGNIDDAFAINQLDGGISLVSSGILNYEKNPEYQLVVEVVDDGVEPLASQCIITINVVKSCEDFVANNIFTPNDDRNGYWIVQNVHLYKDYELVIRTGTGQVVYKVLNYENNWDGTYNNNVLPTGTYYYSLTSSLSGKTYYGFINVISN